MAKESKRARTHRRNRMEKNQAKRQIKKMGAYLRTLANQEFQVKMMLIALLASQGNEVTVADATLEQVAKSLSNYRITTHRDVTTPTDVTIRLEVVAEDTAAEVDLDPAQQKLDDNRVQILTPEESAALDAELAAQAEPVAAPDGI